MPNAALEFHDKLLQTSSLQLILEFAEGTLRQGDPSRTIHGITTDSRVDGHGELFLALRGENFDGHRFVVDSAARGTVGAIVERGFISTSVPTSYSLVEVNDTLHAYHRIAARYRRTLAAKVIAITGSNGKTSTKDLTASVLSAKYRTLKTEGNLNNHVGVPRTLLRAEPEDEMIVLEMGMNHPGEIAPLAEMAQPNIAIITNIGTAHIEFLGSRAGIAQEKGTLAEAVGSSGYVILPSADDFSSAIASRTSAQVIMVGGKDADIRAEDIGEDMLGSRFTLVVGNERMSVKLPVSGRHMVTNALLAVAAGKICGVSLFDCVAALANVRLTKGRMEWKEFHGLHVLDDSYNANPDSMVVALETLARMPTACRRIAVLGKMGELGDASDAGQWRVGEAAARAGVNQLIGVGAETEVMLRAAREAGLEETFAAPDIDAAAHLLHVHANRGDLVLIKGSRSVAMERVLSALDQLFNNLTQTAVAGMPINPSRAP